MKFSILIAFLSILTLGYSQNSKDQLINISQKDTVIQYEGEGTFNSGNCLIIKFTGDPQRFFNELARFHAQDEDQVERTESTLAIFETSKPYWVYGRYSVFAEISKKDDYSLIQIHFKAYSNPDNYRIYGAAREYQDIINRIK